MAILNRSVSLPHGLVVLGLCLCVGCALPGVRARPLKKFTGVMWSQCAVPLSNIAPMYVLRRNELDRDGFSLAAGRAKTLLDGVPVGQRVILMLLPNETLQPSNHAWYSRDSLNLLSNYVGRFCAAYRAVGGTVDAIALDYEDGFSNWHLNTTNMAVYDSIANDARYARDIQAPLKARGFVCDDAHPELYYVCHWRRHPVDYSIWNQVNGERVGEYLNEAIWTPARTYYPRVEFYNYGGGRADARYAFCDSYGHKNAPSSGGGGSRVVSGSAPPCYGRLGQVVDRSPAGTNDPPRPYPRTPFNGMRFDCNRVRTMRLTDPAAPFWPWVAYRGFDAPECAVGRTDYYQEMILHLGLQGVTQFQYWGPYGWGASDEDSLLLNHLLTELDEVAGYADRAWIGTVTTPDNIRNWADHYYLTGMTAGGRGIWRITPDLALPGMTVQKFRISDNPPTFSVGTTRIVFPPGSAVYTPSASCAPNGYWVTAPLGMVPTVNETNGHTGHVGY